MGNVHYKLNYNSISFAWSLVTKVFDRIFQFPNYRTTRIKSGRSLLCKATRGRAQSYVLISLSVHWHICF